MFRLNLKLKMYMEHWLV